jgi:hypothetical protein
MEILLMRASCSLALLLAGLFAAGCSKQGEAKFTPTEARAKQALEKALDAWKGGQPKPGTLKLDAVGVEVVDGIWTSGEKLSGYQIVGEEAGEGPRFFTVKLTLGKGERTVKYAVLGIDPLWVYSEADYKKLGGG